MKKAATVPEYLRAVPPTPRAALQKLRKAIKAAAPGAQEVISYGMPAIKHRGRMLVYYAAFKNHLSLFPASKSVITAHKDDLKGFVTSKGTIQFALEKRLPTGLVKRLVKARIKENLAKWPAD